MSQTLNWHEIMSNPQDPSCYFALALVLRPHANAEGKLLKHPKQLMIEIFGREHWRKIADAIDVMQQHKLLVCPSHLGKPWSLQLPKNIPPDFDYLTRMQNIALQSAAQQLVNHFGPKLIPELVKVLVALTS